MEAIRFDHISKYYPSTGVQASDDISFSIEEGEIHAICGENGAGKSTLMNILFGLEKPDSGSVFIRGAEAAIRSPSDAISMGIGMVHQHFMLVDSFTAAENVLLGIEDKGFLNKSSEREYVRKLSEDAGMPIDPDAPVYALPVGQLQRIEILKMLARNVRILILDEPTAVLTPYEVGPFLETLRKLADSGHTVIFISHKLQEVMDAADRITVMRQGKVIGTKEKKDTSIPELADMMVGRKVLFEVEKMPSAPGRTVLELKDVTMRSHRGRLLADKVSFSVRAGEIYGIAGVSGNGQEALISAIAEDASIESGSILLNGKEISGHKIAEKRALGMAYVPEDRMTTGLNMAADFLDNSIIGFQDSSEMNKGLFLDRVHITERAGKMIDDYQIRGASVDGSVSALSGGNMQKVVLARELSASPCLLIVDQPTRGLDVGSIEFVHRMLIRERDKGVAILLLSVELDEILSLSDRVGVMCRGVLQGELEGSGINEHSIAMLMVGETEEGR